MYIHVLRIDKVARFGFFATKAASKAVGGVGNMEKEEVVGCYEIQKEHKGGTCGKKGRRETSHPYQVYQEIKEDALGIGCGQSNNYA